MESNVRQAGLRVGVVGTSRFTQQFHLDNLRNHPSVQITAICGRNRQRAEKVADRYGITHVFTDYRELVRSPDVDAVVIVTPNYLHYPIANAVLEVGKHIFCEKPLAMNLREAQEMYEKAQSSGVIHMVNFTFRGVPAGIRMKELIDEGYIGKLYHLQVSFMSPNRRGGMMEWRRDRKEAGTGALGDLGSHIIDQARWFAGDIRRVCGHLYTAEPELRLPDSDRIVPNETDDSCALAVEFESGAQGMLHASWVAHPGIGGMELRAEAHGSEGMLRVHYRRAVAPRSWATLRGSRNEDKIEEVLPLPERLLDGLDFADEPSLVRTLSTRRWFAAQRFIEVALGNVEATGTFYDGMKTQAVTDAVVTSHRDGGWVEIG